MRTVSVEDFSRQMSAEPLSALDIRPFEDYQSWHIEGKNVYTRHLDGTSVLQEAQSFPLSVQISPGWSSAPSAKRQEPWEK